MILFTARIISTGSSLPSLSRTLQSHLLALGRSSLIYHSQKPQRSYNHISLRTISSMAPSKQRAAVIQEDGTVALQEMDVPKPGSGEILIKIVATAQNPTDW